MAKSSKPRPGDAVPSKSSGAARDGSPSSHVDPTDRDLLNRKSTLEWKLDQGTAWRGGSLSPVTGLTPPPQPGANAASSQVNQPPRPSRSRQAKTQPPTRRNSAQARSPQPKKPSNQPAEAGEEPLALGEPFRKGDTAPLPKPKTRLVWKNGMDVSDEFREYAECIARGEDLPPFRGNFLADPSALISTAESPQLSLGPGSSPHPPQVDASSEQASRRAERSRAVAKEAQTSSGGLLAVLAVTTAAAVGVASVLWSPTSRAHNPISQLSRLKGEPIRLAKRNPDGTRRVVQLRSSESLKLRNSLVPSPAQRDSIDTKTPKSSVVQSVHALKTKAVVQPPPPAKSVPAATPAKRAPAVEAVSKPRPAPKTSVASTIRSKSRPNRRKLSRPVAKPAPATAKNVAHSASLPRRTPSVITTFPSESSSGSAATKDLLLEESPF